MGSILIPTPLPFEKSLFRHISQPKSGVAHYCIESGFFLFPPRCWLSETYVRDYHPRPSSSAIRHRFPPTRIKSVRSLFISLVAPRPHPPRCIFNGIDY